MENRIIELLKTKVNRDKHFRFHAVSGMYNSFDMNRAYNMGIDNTIKELIIVLKDYDNEILKKLKGYK